MLLFQLHATSAPLVKVHPFRSGISGQRSDSSGVITRCQTTPSSAPFPTAFSRL